MFAAVHTADQTEDFRRLFWQVVMHDPVAQAAGGVRLFGELLELPTAEITQGAFDGAGLVIDAQAEEPGMGFRSKALGTASRIRRAWSAVRHLAGAGEDSSADGCLFSTAAKQGGK